MTETIPADMLARMTTFGDLLRYLRRRAGITQTELSIAVGYSDAQISRLEQNLRLPNISTIQAQFIPALRLKSEPAPVDRLLELAHAALARARVTYVPAYDIGLVYAGLGEFDRWFEYLDKTHAERSVWLAYLRVEPRLDALRSDTRFGALLQRVNLGWDPAQAHQVVCNRLPAVLRE